MVSSFTWSKLSDYLVLTSFRLVLFFSCICIFVYFFLYRVHSHISSVCWKRLTIQLLFIVASLSPGCISYLIFHCFSGIALCWKPLMCHLNIIYIYHNSFSAGHPSYLKCQMVVVVLYNLPYIIFLAYICVGSVGCFIFLLVVCSFS